MVYLYTKQSKFVPEWLYHLLLLTMYEVSLLGPYATALERMGTKVDPNDPGGASLGPGIVRPSFFLHPSRSSVCLRTQALLVPECPLLSTWRCPGALSPAAEKVKCNLALLFII